MEAGKPGKCHDEDQKSLRQIVSQEIRDGRPRKGKLRDHVQNILNLFTSIGILPLKKQWH